MHEDIHDLDKDSRWKELNYFFVISIVAQHEACTVGVGLGKYILSRSGVSSGLQNLCRNHSIHPSPCEYM